MKPGHTGLTRIIKAFGFSMQGLRAAYRHESAFRQEAWLFIVLFPVAFWLGTTPVQIALLAGSLFLVLVTELLNSAIESVVDRVGSEPHELSGRAKDIGSAAVFIALMNVLVIWGLIIWARCTA
ncbi:MAG TPA: diacylglycerol kinase [Gammaproteobacteria bacterium]|nr:diacylglycerol kinase [Gammaproteobacteria bacterium]